MRDLLCKTQRLTNKQSDIIGQEFMKHQCRIDSIIRKHMRRYGGDYNDLLSRAMDTIIVAYLNHDPTRSEWSKYIVIQITLRLLDLRLEGYRRKHQTQSNADEVFQAVPVEAPEVSDSEDSILQSLRDDLSPDAWKFLEYYFQDTDVVCHGRTFRSRFRRDMLEAGWSKVRIRVAMMELEHILLLHVKEG